MEAKKYYCNRCRELFTLIGPHDAGGVRCPRCSGEDIREMTAPGPEAGPPPWEYICRQCGGRFRVKAPRGPSEEKEFRCPRCESRDIKWLTIASEACPPGG